MWLAFAYVICLACRVIFNIDLNMDVWNHKTDECDKITQLSLLRFKLLCVDHCITEGLRSLAFFPSLKLMLLRSARSGKSNFVMFGMRNPTVLVPTTRAMNYEDALRKLASVLNKNQADSLVPRSIWRSSLPRMAGAARWQRPDMETCKKCGNGMVKRRKLMSQTDGIDVFPELRCQSGYSVHMTDLSHLLTHHFPAGIKLYLLLQHKKKKMQKLAHHFFASLHLIPQANVCHHWMSCL